MSYNEELLLRAAEELEKRRDRSEREAKERRDLLVKEYPEIALLEDKMRKSAYDLIKVMGMTEGAGDYVKKLRDKNLDAQDKIKRILIKAGKPEDYLESRYYCEECRDTGFKDGKICKCHLEILKNLSYSDLRKKSPLKLCSFNDFKLDYYSRDPSVFELMKRNLSFCENYAENFDLQSLSVLMRGETGLGKTHLSLAIAGEVIEKNYGVIYGTVSNLLSSLERDHFKKDGEDKRTLEALLSCDLLILDDLGMEFSTGFSVASINNIINTRLLDGLPTIISTNLRLGDLSEKYGRSFTSRIIGEYRILEFRGDDIRQMRARRQNV